MPREGLAESLSEPLQNALKPLLAEVASVSGHIREYDEQIENLAKSRYPETALLQQVYGVGTFTALTYVLTVDDPYPIPPQPGCGCPILDRGLGARSLETAGRSYGLQRKATRR
jgi:hypothetical protein